MLVNSKNELKSNDLGADETGTFTDLYNLIQANETVDLQMDIAYNSNTDGEGSPIDYGDHGQAPFDSYYIEINKNIVINGNGNTIDGKNSSGLFKLAGPYSITLNDLNIVNCQAQRTNLSSTHYGGVIDLHDYHAALIINNCNFTDNSASEGGGVVHSEGPSTISIANSNFNKNNACDGGVIYAEHANVNIENSSFTSNLATNKGGVFYISNNNLIVNSSIFEGNSADQAGVAYAYGTSSDLANITLESSLFENNSASSNGGVAYLANEYAYANMNYNAFINNIADVGSVIFFSSLNSRIVCEDDWWGQNKWDKNFIRSENVPLMPDRRYMLSLIQTGLDSAILTLELEDGAVSEGVLPLREAIVSLPEDAGFVELNSTMLPESIEIDYDILENSTITAKVDNQILTLDVFFVKKYIENLTVSVDDVNLPTQPKLVVNASVDGKYNVTIGSSSFEITVVDGQCTEELSGFAEGNYFVVVSRVDDPLYNDKFAFDSFDVVGIKKGTFTDLQNQINNAEDRILDLTYDFEYDPDYDADRFPEGIVINMPAELHSFYFTINGNGHSISGKDSNRIFYMTQWVGLKLNDLTLCHGLSIEGSAIFTEETSMLRANGVKFISNNATYNGGAIVAIGSVALEYCSFINNSAGLNGGAVYSSIAMDITACVFDGNDLYGHLSAGEYGGAAIYSLVTLKMRDSIVSNNNPGYLDGDNVYGALALFGDCYISNVTFTNNKGRWGGAIGAYTGDGALIILDSLFNENEAYQGGALFTQLKSIVIDNSNFTANSATDGGAIYHDSMQIFGMETTITNSKFDGNTAERYGSATMAMSDFEYSNCNFTNNKAPQGTAVVHYRIDSSPGADDGQGDVDLYDSFIRNCRFQDNSALWYGAVYFWGTKSLHLNQTDFINNMGGRYGGAIRFNGTRLTVDKSTFKGNQAPDGALSLYGDAVITDSVFEDNIGAAKTFNIWKEDDVELTLYGNTFKTIIPSITTDKETYVYGDDIQVNGSFDWGVDGYEITVPVSYGESSYDLENFTAGDFSFAIEDSLAPGRYVLSIATFNASDNEFVVSSNGKAFEVCKMATEIESEDITVYATVSKTMKLTLKGADGNPLAFKDVLIAFDGEIKTLRSDENGVIEVDIKMSNKGTYTISANFAGDEAYESSFAAYNVIVKAKATKLTVSNPQFRLSAKKYVIATLTAGGVPLANKVVTFALNGKTISGRTNSKGVVKVAVSLSAKKTYAVAVAFTGDSTYGSTVAKYKLKVVS